MYLLVSSVVFFVAAIAGRQSYALLRGNTELSLKCILALYLTRDRWLPILPLPPPLYARLPSSFSTDMESGFSSETFDLQANIDDLDQREGLDTYQKAVIAGIMRIKKVDFDEARRLFMMDRFVEGGIFPDGRPNDPKAVTFSSNRR